MALGHAPECFCSRCCDEELNTIAAERGIVWGAGEIAGTTAAVRTRYAKPGQACGAGVVRHVSPAQVAYLKRLMAERDTSNLKRLPGSENIERMSLAGARDLIEKLLGCPKRTNYVRPATPGQLSFIRSLIERKGAPDVADSITTFDGASKAIEILKQMSDKPKAPGATGSTPTAVELTVGIYRHNDGRIVQAKPNRQGTRMYGKLYDSAGRCWVYEPGLLRGLTEAHRMTLEECKALSVELGACCMCGCELTATVDGVPPSERYIGPICKAKIEGN